MIRTLGWNKNHIVLITVMKSVIFQILPSIAVGLILTFIGAKVGEAAIFAQLGYDLLLDFSGKTALVALLMATLLPLAAIIQPVYQSLSVELRDALD